MHVEVEVLFLAVGFWLCWGQQQWLHICDTGVHLPYDLFDGLSSRRAFRNSETNYICSVPLHLWNTSVLGCEPPPVAPTATSVPFTMGLLQMDLFHVKWVTKAVFNGIDRGQQPHLKAYPNGDNLISHVTYTHNLDYSKVQFGSNIFRDHLFFFFLF